MPPAARVTDMHVCPMVTVLVPHVGGPILPPGAPTVLIGFLPAATVTSMATCVGPPDIIVKGSAGVFINFLPAARMGDITAHGGSIILGEPTVMIGEIGAPCPGAGGMGGVTAGLAATGLSNPISPNASVDGTAGTATSSSSSTSLSVTTQTAAFGSTPADPSTPEGKTQMINSACAANGITDPLLQASHCKAADLTKPVTIETLKKGDKIDMWVRNGGVPGMYSAPPGTDPLTCGIDIANRHLEQFEVQEEMKVLKSFAADFPKGAVPDPAVGGKGGGPQYILPPNWKNMVKPT